MKNENRAVFDRTPEPIDYAFDLPAEPCKDVPDAPARATSANIVSRLIRRIAERWRLRRNRQALLKLSDEQLKDIGISRCQAYGGYSRYRQSEAYRLERQCF